VCQTSNIPTQGCYHSYHKKAEVQISSDVSICVFNELIIMDHSDHKKAEVQISSDVSICVFNALIIMDLAVH